MRIEYQDGKIHNVECYRFCKSRLDNGEKIYFIEYKDFTDKTNGEYEDCYAIVENNNGIWQKVGKEIRYDILSSKVIEEFNPKILGDYLGFANKNRQQVFIPKTQTQPQKEKVDFEDSKHGMDEIFVPVVINDSGMVVDPAFDIPTLSYYRITGGMTRRGLSYNSITRKEINRNSGTYATFDFVVFPNDFGKLFDEQNERIMSSGGPIPFVKLEDIICENKIYKFVPVKFPILANEGFNTQLDVKLPDKDDVLTPKEILEYFGDYRLNEGYINDGFLIQKIPMKKIANKKITNKEQNVINIRQSRETTNTLSEKNELKDARDKLVESKKEIERLRQENEQLKQLLSAYQNKKQLNFNQSNSI